MRTPWKLSIVALGLAAVAAGCSSSPQRNSGLLGARGADADDNEQETLITLNELPASVKAALAGITSDAQVTQVTRDQADDRTTYDVEYTKDGVRWAVEFSDTGAVLENEVDDDENDDDDEDGDDD